jgi:hypothetical protein
MMKKRRCTGLVYCFNSQWNGGASTVTRKVGVTSDVLLACLLHSFQASTQARARAWPWNWTCINKGKQKHAGYDLRHWGARTGTRKH